MFRRLIGKDDLSTSNDPYDILRKPAGRASRRFTKLMSSGRRPSMQLVDRVAIEKEEQANRFLNAVGAVLAGRAFYTGTDVYIDPTLGSTPSYVYSTSPSAFRDAQHWLLTAGGTLLPRHDQHDGGYSCVQMHSMRKSGVVTLLDEASNDILPFKWGVAAGEIVEVTVLTPAGLEARLQPDHDSPAQIVASGTVVRFIDFSGDWALVSSTDGDELGWTLHSLLGA